MQENHALFYSLLKVFFTVLIINTLIVPNVPIIVATRAEWKAFQTIDQVQLGLDHNV